MRTLTALDSKILDINSESLGVPVDKLMDNAGNAIANYLGSNFPEKRVAFICGTGNNGGDGITAASKMDLSKVTVFLIKSPEHIHSTHIRTLLDELKCPIREFSEFDGGKYDVIVDCVLGTGLSGRIRDPYIDVVLRINEFDGPVISIDVPSGLGTDLSVEPDVTITFHTFKEGMNESNSGEIVVVDIDIPIEAETVVGPGDMLRYPLSESASHKGENGRLLIIGGGPYFGAPVLAALAAMRIGTDIVRIAAPYNCRNAISAASPVLMFTEVGRSELKPACVPSLIRLSEDYDAVLIGPGSGVSDPVKKTTRRFVSECKIPIVIDADGITALGNDFIGNEKIILTPHRREFENLGGKMSDRAEDSVTELSKRIRSTVILKGKEDIIALNDRVRVNKTGSPGMTSAGTGDVLSGIVAGLLSKGMNPFDAACLGAYISGKAGEFAFEERSYGLIATDVIDMMPRVLKEGLGR